MTNHFWRLGLGGGLLVGLFLFWRRGRRAGFSEEGLLDLALASFLGALVGGKVTFALFHWQMYTKSPELVLRVWEGPFSFLGVALGFLAMGVFFVRRRGWSFKKVADLAVIPLALAQGIYYSGQLWPWFGDYWLLSKALFCLALFLGLALTQDWFSASGFTATLYLVAFSLLELADSFWRPDLGFGAELFWTRFFYLVLLVGGVLGWAKLREAVLGPLKMSFPKNILEPIKHRLLREDKELAQQQLGLEKSEPYLEPGRTEINADLIEDAQEDVAQARYAVVQDSVTKMRRQIQKALAKVHLGTYGKCERCHTSIDPARLKAFPAATLCLECAEKEEAQAKAAEESPEEEISL